MNDIELKLEDYITRADVNVAVVEDIMSEEEALKYVTDVAARVWFQENMDDSSDDFSSDDLSSDDSGDEPEIHNDEIHYTATSQITPNDTTVFGVNYLPEESTFDETTGEGVLKFDGEVTSIGKRAFRNCTGLTSIMIPDSVTSIGESAFSNCSDLTFIEIPDGVTSIEVTTFSGCTGLTTITIPDSVTSIGDGAFYECSGLTSVTIGNGVTSIERGAFRECVHLTSITSKATTPPKLNGEYIFYNSHCPIYVPTESVEAYKSSWPGYVSRIQAISE